MLSQIETMCQNSDMDQAGNTSKTIENNNLELAEALPNAPFRELHKRTVNQPIDDVWQHCIDVEIGDVRTMGPLMALRHLPKQLSGKKSIELEAPDSLLDAFAANGFIILRQDPEPIDGRAVILFGAAGKFWSVTSNEPRLFASPQEFLDFDEPGWARTVCRLEAIDNGDGTTRVETETLIAGTDSASTRKFAPYWAIIRLPSGLIRRSWLAAIDRRATRFAKH